MKKRFLATASLALLLAACNTAETEETAETNGGAESADETTEESHDHHHEEEVDGMRVAIGHEGGVTVTDGSFTILETFETGTSAMALAPDERHVFLNAREDGYLQLLDLGVWNEDHGDHGHLYAEDPLVSDAKIEGDQPTHVVSHGGKTAIFYDGSGTTEVYDDFSTEEKPEPVVTIAGVAHHGVAVPLSNGHYAVTYTDEADPQPLPNGVAIFDESGNETARFEECPGLHGEASTGTGEDEIVAFGCAGQVFTYQPAANEGNAIALPDENARVGTIKSHDDSLYMLGNYSSEEKPELNTNVSILNTTDQTVELLDLGTPYIGSMLVTRTGAGYVLGTDGVLYEIDLAAAEITSETQAVEPFEVASGHGHGAPTPSLGLHQDGVLITDPVAGELLHLHDGEVESVLTLDEAPLSVLSVSVGE